jgi:hypothetical protein
MRKVRTPGAGKLKIRNKLIRPTKIKSRDILEEKCTSHFYFYLFKKINTIKLELMVT